jgi:hypothetical protein
MVNIGRGWLVAGVCVGLAVVTARDAGAQLSGSTGSTSGSSCSGSNNSSGYCGNSRQTLVNNGTTFQSRYAWNIHADVGAGSTRDTAGTASHRVSFTATAPGSYRVTIATRRTGDMNRRSDVSGCDGRADISGVTGSSNIALSSGTLSLGAPGSIGNGGGNTDTPFDQTANATINRVSNGVGQSHSLTFTWSGSVRSNSCEAAVRVGQQNGTTTSCPACGYAGSPSRTQSNDGHFVTVTFTSFCGNGVVDGVGEACDQGGANGTTSCCTRSVVSRPASATSPRSAAARATPAPPTASSHPRPSVAPLPGSATWPRTHGLERPMSGQCLRFVQHGLSRVCGICDVAETCTVCRPDAGQCDVADTCTGSAAACPPDAFEPDGTACDDTDLCTFGETCTSGACGGGTNTNLTCNPCEACDPGTGNCGPGPRTDCLEPSVAGKARVLIKDKTPDKGDLFVWKWVKGEATTLADFGDPTTTDAYTLCVFDDGTEVFRANIPAGPFLNTIDQFKAVSEGPLP